MSAMSSSPSALRKYDDGFDKIPINPRQAYLVQSNPVLYHLPTKLAAHKRDTWRLSWLLEDMTKGDVVVLWQGGPQAGIYGVALPYGDPFETTNYPGFQKMSRHYGGGRLCIKLQYIYVLAQPLLKTALESCKVFHTQTVIGKGISKPGYRIGAREWKSIYKLLKNNRDTAADTIKPGRTSTAVALNELSDIAVPRTESQQDDLVTDNYADLETLAHQVWPLLTQATEANIQIHPRKLAEQLNVPLERIRDCLDLIGNTCNSENFPSFALAIQPNASDENPELPDFKVSIASFQSLFQQENNFTSTVDWKLIPNPFDFVLEATADQLVERLVENPAPEESSAVYRLVKVRGSAQLVFAKMMRRIYDNQCAFCGFSLAPALEAAHIKPWPMCTPAERLLPSNGLLLCAVHHKLFDAGLISMTERHVIKVFAPESLTSLAMADDYFVCDLDGTSAHLPRDPRHQPSPEFLNFRKKLVTQIFER